MCHQNCLFSPQVLWQSHPLSLAFPSSVYTSVLKIWWHECHLNQRLACWIWSLWSTHVWLWAVIEVWGVWFICDVFGFVLVNREKKRENEIKPSIILTHGNFFGSFFLLKRCGLWLGCVAGHRLGNEQTQPMGEAYEVLPPTPSLQEKGTWPYPGELCH